MYEIIGDHVTLKFALKTDMRKIYEMMVSEEVKDFLFDQDHPAPDWDSFFMREHGFFPEMASRSGSYLLIYFEDRLAGTIKYSCGYEKRPYGELTMWLAGYEFIGKNIETEAINLLRSYIHEAYGIHDFIVRAWMRNLADIATYNRCGFHESAAFDLGDFYSDEDMTTKASGVYGPHETLNLHCNLSEMMVS